MGDAMKVWTNRVPIDLVERWGARAEAEAERTGEAVTGSGMLRHVMEEALARPRIMPASGSAPRTEGTETGSRCPHPRDKRRRLGYATTCGECGVAL